MFWPAYTTNNDTKLTYHTWILSKLDMVKRTTVRKYVSESFYKRHIKLVQLQICLLKFRFERICLCANNISFICFNLSIHSLNSNASLNI